MKINKIKNIAIQTLFICGLLLIASQAAFAAKGGNKPTPEPPPPSAIVIDAVVVDFSTGNIEVTGSGLDTTLDTLTIGGVDVLSDSLNLTQSEGSLVLELGPSGATAVPRPGSYSLALNGNAFSVYFSSAVIDPVTADCPCVGIWSSYGAASPPDGFNGVDQFCTYESSIGDQVAVQFINFATSQVWILTSEFNTTATECALVIDEPTVTLNSQLQHEACSTYLKTTYIDASSAPDCGSITPLP